VEHVQKVVGVSERRACKVLGQARSTQRYQSVKPEGDQALVAAMDELRQKHKRCGYRGIWIRLRRKGWWVNLKRVHRIWKAEGWQIRTRKRKRRGTGSSANSCAVKRAEYRGHVWTYDFVLDRTEYGGLLKFLPVLDEYTREAHAIEVGRSFTGSGVVEVLLRLFRIHGEPAYIRSDNGSEFIARVVQEGLAAAGVSTLFIAPGSPWENGYSESFNSRFRDEFLDRELFWGVQEAAVLAEQHRVDYNTERPHMSLRYLTPAEFAAGCEPPGLLPRPAGEASDSPGAGEP
jgi:transposase InsO family protein